MASPEEHPAREPNNSRLGRLVDWFIPEALMRGDQEELRKARLMVWICLVSIVLLLPLGAVVLTTSIPDYVALLMLAAIASYASAMLGLRRGMPPRWLAIWLTAFPLCGVSGVAFALGGIHAPTAQVLVLIPVFGFFMGGPRHGLVTLAFATAAHIALGIQAAGPTGDLAIVRTVSLIALDGFLYLLVDGFHKIAARARQRLDRSVGELRRSNRLLQQARDATEEALQAKNRLLTTMSHEVRTPMSGVVGRGASARDAALARREAQSQAHRDGGDRVHDRQVDAHTRRCAPHAARASRQRRLRFVLGVSSRERARAEP